MTTITGIYLFKKLLDMKESFSFEEFRLSFINCILLSQKMYEDQIITSGKFYDTLNLSEQNIDFDDFLETEKKVLISFDYNLFVKYEEIEKFLKKETLTISKKIVDNVWKRCQNFFKKRSINQMI